jgi:hypothetical protein
LGAFGGAFRATRGASYEPAAIATLRTAASTLQPGVGF